MKIGLFFGSFNPIHVGHLIISTYVLNISSAQEVWFIVSPQNPFKKNDELLDEHARLKLVEKAISGNRAMKISRVEFKLPRPSFTVDTLSYLEEKHPDHEFLLIMGSDSFQQLDKWKDFEKIIAKHKILVYRRPGFEIETKLNAEIEILNAPLLGISSTEIRDLIKHGKSIRYLVPEKVRKEIKKNEYYKK